MAKKKSKHSAKDDLIESLMNDVKEISEQPTVHKAAPKDELFLNGDDDGPDVIGLGEENSHLGDGNTAAKRLWQGLNDDVPVASLSGANPSKSDLAAAIENSEDSEKDALLNFESGSGKMPTMGTSESSQNSDPDNEITFPVGFENPERPSHDDRTINIDELSDEERAALNPHANVDSERTVAVEGFASRQPRRDQNEALKNLGPLRQQRSQVGSVHASTDATLIQAESLKIAQQRILDLEREVEKYRQENEELASAGEIVRSRCDELTSKVYSAEKEKQDLEESLNNELLIVKGTAQYKDAELAKTRQKIEELEIRLKADFKKIRVRERELENRLELVKAEKSALLRAKDENILDLKRKIDHLQGELDNYRSKVVELNKNIDLNQEQFKRTVRALRLALSNLETKEENLVPLKKAE